MTIDGTSTLHDWTSIVESLEASAKIFLSDGDIADVQDLTIYILVNSIKSGKSGMDKNTYKALKEPEYPKINFNLNSIKKNSGSLNYEGALTIGGNANDINGVVSYKLTSAANISFSGEIIFNMSEFDIDPPKAMMGTIKTGDQVTIKYNLVFNKKE
jgi:polyisoprenoid-binding protein YceI